MGLEDIYDKKLRPLYPDATDQYLNGLPPEASPARTDDVAELPPAERQAYLAGVIQSNQFDLRSLEVAAKAIAIRASFLRAMISKHPEVATALPEELKSQVEDWASRADDYEPHRPELTN